MQQKQKKNYEQLYQFLNQKLIDLNGKVQIKLIKKEMNDEQKMDFKEICNQLNFVDEVVIMKVFVQNRGDLDNTKLDLKFFVQNNQSFEESTSQEDIEPQKKIHNKNKKNQQKIQNQQIQYKKGLKLEKDQQQVQNIQLQPEYKNDIYNDQNIQQNEQIIQKEKTVQKYEKKVVSSDLYQNDIANKILIKNEKESIKNTQTQQEKVEQIKNLPTKKRYLQRKQKNTLESVLQQISSSNKIIEQTDFNQDEISGDLKNIKTKQEQHIISVDTKMSQQNFLIPLQSDQITQLNNDKKNYQQQQNLTEQEKTNEVQKNKELQQEAEKGDQKINQKKISEVINNIDNIQRKLLKNKFKEFFKICQYQQIAKQVSNPYVKKQNLNSIQQNILHIQQENFQSKKDIQTMKVLQIQSNTSNDSLNSETIKFEFEDISCIKNQICRILTQYQRMKQKIDDLQEELNTYKKPLHSAIQVWNSTNFVIGPDQLNQLLKVQNNQIKKKY